MESALAIALVALAACTLNAERALAQAPAPVDLTLLAINDFHGNLRPSPGGIVIDDPADASKKITVPPAAPSTWRRW